MAFTTGGHAHGYTLQNIEARMARGPALPSGGAITAAEAGTIRAQLWTDVSSTGTKVADLTVPVTSIQTLGSSYSAVRFAAPTATILKANTTYYLIVFSTASLPKLAWSYTGSDDEDSGAFSGWSIANTHYTYNALPNQNPTRSPLRRNALQIRVNGTEASPPATPRNLRVSPFGQFLNLTWDRGPGGGPVAGYDVHYTSADASTVADDAAVQTGSAADGWVAHPHSNRSTVVNIYPLTNGREYRVRVRAKNGVGASDWLHGQGTPQAAGTRPAVRNFSVTPGDRSLVVRWTAPAVATGHTLTRYTLQYKTFLTPWQTDTRSIRVGGNAYSIPIQGLTNGVAYDVRVRASYGSVHSLWVSGRGTPDPVPGVVQNVAASAADSSLTLTWEAPASGADPTGYDVEYRKFGVDDWTDAGHSGTTGSQTISSLVNGVLYELRVRATNDAGEGPWAETRAGPTASSQTVVGFAKELSEVTEGHDPKRTVTLTIVPPLAAAGTASVRALTGDAAHTAGEPGGNYRLPASVALPAGAHTATFDVPIPDDDLAEARKTLVVGLDAAASGQAWTADADRSRARMYIWDSDVVTPSFQLGSQTILEGHGTHMVVVLDRVAEYDFTLVFQGGTDSDMDTNDATLGTDYVIEGSPVTVPAGTTELNRRNGGPSFRTLYDDQAELDEIFLVGMTAGSVPTGGRALPSPNRLEVTIFNNVRDAWGVTAEAGDGRLELTWNGPDAGHTETLAGYAVHYTSSTSVADDADVQTGANPSAASGWVAVDRGTETDPPTASQAILDLTNGTAYRVRVGAAFASGISRWAFAEGTPEASGAPTNLVVTPGNVELAVSWTRAPGAFGGYELDFTSAAVADVADDAAASGTDPTVAWVSVYTNPARVDTSYTIDSDDAALVNGRTYRVRLRTTAPESAYIFATGTPARPDTGPINVHPTEDGVWSAILTVDENSAGTHFGCDDSDATHENCSAALSKRQFRHKGTTYAVEQVYTEQSGGTTTLRVGFPLFFPSGHGVLYIADATTRGSPYAELPLADADGSSNTDWIWENITGVNWADGDRVRLKLVMFPRVSLSVDPATIEEGDKDDNDARATVTATLDAPWNADRDVVVPLIASNGTAEEISGVTESGVTGDWSIEVRGILIRRGETTGAVTVRAWSDTVTEGSETMTVALDTAKLPQGVTAGTATSVTITITDPQGGGGTEGVTVTITPQLYALIQQIEGWRDDPRHSSNRAHIARWNRVLLAFGWEVKPASDGSLQPMTAAEAQGYADRGWTRWVAVAAVLRDIEGPPPPPPPEPDPVVTIAGGSPVTEGAAASFSLTSSPAPSADLAVEVSVTQSGAFAAASALGTRTVTIPAGTATASFTVATVDDSTDEADGGIVATLAAGAGYTLGDTARASVKVADNDEDNPDIVTKKAIAREGSDDAVVFTVRLDRPAAHTVTVDWATADGSGSWAGTAPARAGADYTATSGTLTFAAGVTSQTVSVPILDDAIDEGTEYFLLRFSNPDGATLAAGERETQGLIMNDDHLQSMWLARFGTMAGAHLTDAVSDRLGAGLAPGAHATLGGERLDLTRTGDAEALAEAVAGLARAFGAEEAPANDDPFARHDPSGRWNTPAASAPARSMTGRELLLGSAFHVAPEREGAGPALAAWGRVAHGSFDAEHADDTGRTRIDGEVLTGVLGADADFGRVLAGVAVSLSEGDGKYDSPGVDVGAKGDIESTLTTVSPYLRFKLTERVSAWGLAGWGTGDMTIRFDDGAMDPVRTDIGMRMGAVGARGALLEEDETGGMDLALKADAFFVRMESEAAENSAETTTDTNRVRLVLEGGRAFSLSESATLRPSLELGLRHDGGDAETGAGLEVGGGVAFTNTATGLSLEAKARMLAAHADSDYEEWGMSATARLDPGETGRGLSLSLAPTIGATSSASERLWGARDARALAPDTKFEAARGLQAEAGYGLPAFGGRFTGTPNVGLGLADGGARDWRLGWRLTSAVPGDSAFEVNLDATRREAANDEAPEHSVILTGTVRW